MLGRPSSAVGVSSLRLCLLALCVGNELLQSFFFFVLCCRGSDSCLIVCWTERGVMGWRSSFRCRQASIRSVCVVLCCRLLN